MSTVPGFPNAASVLPTDTLWITRGTGVDRDLEATVAHATSGGLLGLLDSGAYRSNYVPVIVPGTGATRLPLSAFIPEAVDLGKLSSNIPLWRNGDGIGNDLSLSAISSKQWCVIRRSAGHIPEGSIEGGAYEIEVHSSMPKLSSGPSNSNKVALYIGEAALPSAWASEWTTRLAAGAATLYASRVFGKMWYQSSNGVFGEGSVNLSVTGSPGLYSFRLISTVAWSSVFDIGSGDAHVEIKLSMLPIDPASTLA